jgi:flagellar export protein FliJ
MKKFSFSLESVLTLRNWEEQRAQSAFGKARHDELVIRESLSETETRIEEDMADLRDGSGRVLPAGERALRWRHLIALDEVRNKMTETLMGARQNTERARKVLIDAHRRVLILEKLKARKELAHVADMRRAEDREIDELVSARFQPDL